MLQLLLHPLLTFIESLIRENDISVMVEKRNFAVPLYCPDFYFGQSKGGNHKGCPP